MIDNGRKPSTSLHNDQRSHRISVDIHQSSAFTACFASENAASSSSPLLEDVLPNETKPGDVAPEAVDMSKPRPSTDLTGYMAGVGVCSDRSSSVFSLVAAEEERASFANALSRGSIASPRLSECNDRLVMCTTGEGGFVVSGSDVICNSCRLALLDTGDRDASLPSGDDAGFGLEAFEPKSKGFRECSGEVSPDRTKTGEVLNL